MSLAWHDTVNAVKRLAAEIVRRDANTIDERARVTAIGIDSLALVVLREKIEQRFGVSIQDDTWLRFRSLEDIVTFLHERDRESTRSAESSLKTKSRSIVRPGMRLTPEMILHHELEIGMPHTGLMNLAETPLLKYLGDLRWAHISAVCDVPICDLRDLDGHRLYPTFFYVELAFPENRPMASFGENDVLKMLCTLERYGDSMLDGVTYMFPADRTDAAVTLYPNLETAVEAGVPAARFSNIFVHQYDGSEWLKKSRVSNRGFRRITKLTEAPDSYMAARQAQKDLAFKHPGSDYLRMTEGTVRVEYDLVTDRDLNGAGLVYFANYPVFLDISERKVLAEAKLSLPQELIDKRTLVRRQSAYLGNASIHDTVQVDITAWVQNPVRAGLERPEQAPIRLFLNYRMTRRSDGRLMMISTAEKTVFGHPFEDTPFAAELFSQPEEQDVMLA
jgi:probable biosynthetic protein (TIGR04098 family)